MSIWKNLQHGKVLTALCAMVFASALSVPAYAEDDGDTADNCPNSQIVGAGLITDVCWSCVLPIRVMGVPVNGSNSGAPNADYSKQTFCMCRDSNGVPEPGVVVSFWEPYRLIEFERTPGCLSVLNGTKLNINKMNMGRHELTDVTSDGNRANTIFTHYHYYAYPLMTMLTLFAGKGCNPGGYSDMDLMYLSEIDPTWSDSEISAFTNPEALLFANPASIIACLPDDISAAFGYPISALFWCAGTWGSVYPINGNLNDSAGVLRATSLFAVRVITQLHRRGFAYKTIGDAALCNGVIAPYLTKSQYKFTLAWPVPETTSDHKIGQLVETWGINKRIPVTGEDVIYLIWRWLDCCSRY